MDMRKLCLLRRQIKILITIDGWDSNRRWKKRGKFCSRSRYIVVPGEKHLRLRKYGELLPRFLEARALAFSSDYGAIEAMNFFFDKGIRIPDQISITGYDDSIYASMVRPKLTYSSSGCPAKSTCGVEMSDETDQGRKAGRIKYKKSGLSGKEGFCQGMTGSFFFCTHRWKVKRKALCKMHKNAS